MESVARIIGAEIDLATGIVIEQVAEEPERPQRRFRRTLIVLAAIAGLASAGFAVGAVRSSEPAEPGRAVVVRTGVQVARLRAADAPCARGASDLLVCGVASGGTPGGTLHE